MSALGRLVVSLALDHAEYTQGLDRSSQEALKFAQNSQKSLDRAGRSAKEFLGNVAGNIGGAIVSVVGLNAAFSRVTESINILNSLDDAAQKTGSSIEDLSKIEQVARNFGDVFNPIEQGITRLAKGLAEIDDPSSNAIRALDAIGVSARDSNGELRTAADVYIDVARSLQQYEDGTRKTAVAQALFGKSGAELLPMLNNLAQGVDHVTGVTQANASQAALFNDQLALGKARVTGFFTSLSVDLLPTLNNIASALNNSTGQIGSFSAGSSVAVSVLKGLAIAGFTVVDTFRGMGREIGARAAQLAALASMDFSGAKFIGEALAEDNIKSRAEYDKFVDTVLNGEQRIAQAVDSGGTKKAIDFQVKLPAAVDASTNAIEKQTKAFDIELHKLKEYESEAKRARDITESVATKQERYNQTLEELERLRPHMSVEAYTRALDKAGRELQDVGAVNRQVTTEIDQLWIQAGRNIQSTFSNSIFDFFNDGLDGMWHNAKSAVGRILSEFAALKLSQSIGLSALFAIPGSAGGGGGTGASLSNLLNIGSIGSSLSGGLKNGFGSVLGRGASALGFSSFGSGASGAASAGVFGAGGLNYLGGAGTALGTGSEFGAMASMGSSFAAAAGPVMGLLVADQLTKMFAGDKLISNSGIWKAVSSVPIIGVLPNLINGLFGHGPRKFRQEVAIGDVSAEGFDGRFTRVDRAKGGLLVGNKHWEYASPDSAAFQEVFDTAIQGYAASAKDFAKNLGLSTDAVTGYSKTIRLESEKNKALTEEQINSFLRGIGNEFAQGILPIVDTLKKAGEDSLTTLGRLSTEFTTLSDAAMNLGASAAYAKDLVNGLSIEQRSAFVDKAGGTDSLLGLTQYFAERYLTPSEQIAPVITMLGEELGKLGIQYTTDITKDQAKSLIQSDAITGDMRLSLLQLLPSFDLVKDTLDQIAAAAPAAADGLADVTREINVRNAADTEYGQRLNKSIADTTAAISELESIANQLLGTVNSINPLSVEQARRIVSGGNLNDPNLQAALSVLGGMGSDGFSSGLDFQRAKGKNAGAVIGLQDIVSGGISQKNGELSQFMFEEELLQQGLVNAASAYSAALPRFASGSSYVPQTGLAMVHQGERIINPQQNQDLILSNKQQAKEIKELKVSIENLKSMFRNAMEETSNGLAFRMVAS